MALASTVLWEVKTTGSDTANAGGFNPSNTSMATDLTVTTGGDARIAAPVVKSASYNFATRDVGHWLFIKAGTNWTAGWYQIVSVASNEATLNATAGAGVLNIAAGPQTPTTVTGIATVQTPSSGTWTIDYSQAAGCIAFTDLVAATTITFTSTTNPIGKNFVGNLISITSGTGWNVARWEVSSVTGTTGSASNFSTGTTIATASSTGGTGGLGGALASIGKAGEMAAGATVWISSGTYLIGGGTTNTSGNSVTTQLTNAPVIWSGYQAVRGDRAIKPVLQATAGSITILSTGTNAHGSLIQNLKVDGGGQASVTAFSTGSSRSSVDTCDAFSCAVGFTGGAGAPMFCLADTCALGYASNMGATASVARACGTGFGNAGSAYYNYCIAYSCTGAGFGDNNGGGVILAANCVAYGNGGAGFTVVSAHMRLLNCLAVNNASKGFFQSYNSSTFRGCAVYNNTGGNDGTYISLTGDPFTNAANGDFSLNNTAGAGAACRLAGTPGVFPGGLTIGYLDIGAVQSKTAASGSISNISRIIFN